MVRKQPGDWIPWKTVAFLAGVSLGVGAHFYVVNGSLRSPADRRVVVETIQARVQQVSASELRRHLHTTQDSLNECYAQRSRMTQRLHRLGHHYDDGRWIRLARGPDRGEKQGR